jgi:glycosyltransferase involved in cell wall biosynthesis
MIEELSTVFAGNLMQVLIITSEELHENDTHSSCFELAQAKALMQRGIKVAILSMGAVTTKSFIKGFFLRLAGKHSPESRLKNMGIGKLFINGVKTFIKTIFHLKTTRRLQIDGVTVYEALISRNRDFFINHLNHKICIDHGFKTAKDYIEDHGKPNLVHAHSRFLLASLLALEIKKEYKIPYLITEHSSYYVRDIISNDFKKMVVRTIEEAALFTTVSQKLGDWVNNCLDKNYPQCRLPNIIDVLFEQAIPPGTKKNGSFTFLNVAALNKNKGHEFILQAFSKIAKKYTDAMLQIAGAGEELIRLKDLAKKLGLDKNLVFLGHLPVPRVRQEMLACDCFVLGSEFETFGVVIIEAQACGKPVISTRCGGPEELINEKNGLLVPVHDAESLAGAMMQVYNNREVYDAELIRENCIRQYGQQAVAEKLISVYNTILDPRDNNN